MISSQWSYRRRIFKIDLKLHKNNEFRIIWVENIYMCCLCKHQFFFDMLIG